MFIELSEHVDLGPIDLPPLSDLVDPVFHLASVLSRAPDQAHQNLVRVLELVQLHVDALFFHHEPLEQLYQ